MFGKLKYILCFWFLLWASVAAAKSPTIMVLPFEIKEGGELLSSDLSKMLMAELSKLGIGLVSPQKVEQLVQKYATAEMEAAAARDLALLGKADFAVHGVLTKSGELISFEAILIEAYGLRGQKSLTVNKKGTLLEAVREFAKQIHNKMQFKQGKERIAEIRVEGNRILEKDAVLTRLSIGVGDIFDAQKLNEDLHRLYDFGYFKDITILVDDTSEGRILTFRVEEKPLIEKITVLGAKEVKSKSILEVVSSKKGAVLNDKVAVGDIEKIRELYRKKGYYNAKVKFETEQYTPRQANLKIVIDEGKKLYIRSIRIEGAKQLNERDVKKNFASKEKGFFSWLTGSGILKTDMLMHDTGILEAYYADRGFVDVKVGQPNVDFKEDGIYIVFKVEEGKRYKVGQVFFGGDILTTGSELLEVVQFDQLHEDGKYFNRSVLQADVQRLSEYYSDFGYAFASASPSLEKNGDIVNVTYFLDKGNKVYIRQVLIQGNTKTRNNVILREMRLNDGQLYSGSLLRRSKERLLKLDYFKTADIESIPFQDQDAIDLVVNVEDKSTGAVSAGAGYSSLEKFFIVGQIQERNLFGKGYSLGLKGNFGSRTTTYDISFWNPNVYDSDLGMGFDAYIRENNWLDYDKYSVGGALKAGIPVGEYSSVYSRYRLEEYDISNVAATASERIKEMKGHHWSSSLFVSISRDTTNRRINPTDGTNVSLSVEYAGNLLGGDDCFVKYIADGSWYHSLFWTTVLHLHSQLGYVAQNGEGSIPLFERFYLGGMNSIRGYPNREIAPRDKNTIDKELIGGDKQFFTNVEFLIPLSEEVGLVGLFFFDIGNTWNNSEKINGTLYKSVGAGLRWFSPMGPLRLEYGYPLDELEGTMQKGRFEFSIGQFF